MISAWKYIDLIHRLLNSPRAVRQAVRALGAEGLQGSVQRPAWGKSGDELATREYTR